MSTHYSGCIVNPLNAYKSIVNSSAGHLQDKTTLVGDRETLMGMNLVSLLYYVCICCVYNVSWYVD